MILNLKVHLISSFRCKFYLQPVVQVSDLSTALGVFNEKWTITDTTDDSLEHWLLLPFVGRKHGIFNQEIKYAIKCTKLKRIPNGCGGKFN
jgi:hypothetical protein